MLKSPNAFAASLVSTASGPEGARAALLGAPVAYPNIPARFWLDVFALVEDERSAEDRAIDLAEVHFDVAARRQFAADGSQDVGTCGGVMLGYRGNTRFAKALVARGIGRKMDGTVYLTKGLPADVRTQNMYVGELAHRAFAMVAEAAGFLPTEHRSYVD